MNHNHDKQLPMTQAISDIQSATSIRKSLQLIRWQQQVRLLKAERYSTTRLWYKHTHQLV